jgi:hypothetical protein
LADDEDLRVRQPGRKGVEGGGELRAVRVEVGLRAVALDASFQDLDHHELGLAS